MPSLMLLVAKACPDGDLVFVVYVVHKPVMKHAAVPAFVHWVFDVPKYDPCRAI